MLKIPVDTYSPPLDVVVDLTDEGRPRLSLELHASEIAGSWQKVEDHVEPVIRDHEATDDPKQLRIIELECRLELAKDQLAAMTRHRDHLLGKLDRISVAEIDRELDPDHARAIAAALWHYAGEADAFGRRP